MDTYESASQAITRLITTHYSTSFGTASRLFAPRFRMHIYNIYGLVRIADEIVDSYAGDEAKDILDELEHEITRAQKRGHSANPVVHAFILTSKKFAIDPSLVTPFFHSMRLDIGSAYHTKDYDKYIYGSAEVVGLMCLKVYCEGNEALFRQLKPGAQALGAAFQKVNFLRDMADDYNRLGRYYFPIGTYKTFDESTKTQIIVDIKQDFSVAQPAIQQLPAGSKLPVLVAASYYKTLLKKLETTDVDVLKQRRIRISNIRKVWIIVITSLRYTLWEKRS